MALEMSLLGAPVVEVDGRPLEVDTRKALALLAYLAVSEAPTSRDTLAGLLWPESDQSRARAALRRTLSTLRRALGDRWIGSRGDVVLLDPADRSLDLAELRRLVAETESHGHGTADPCPACVEPLERAVSLHRGGFMAGFSLRDSLPFEEWHLATAEAAGRDVATAYARLVAALVAAGRLEDASGRAGEWLALDRLHEPAHRWVMLVHAWRGDRAGAIRRYREAVAVLQRELGVMPLEETMQLAEAIEEGRPPSPPRLVPATSRAPVAPPLPFVGREGLFSEILSTIDAVGPDGRLVVLEGEAGIGKTRLAAEVVASRARAGAPTIGVVAHEGESDVAYGLVAEAVREAWGMGLEGLAPGWLDEVSRLVPEIAEDRGVEPPEPVGSAGGRHRFLEAIGRVVTRALDGPPPGLLVLDDLQWADPASLGALGYLVRRLAGRPVAVLAVWRSEAVPRGHLLRRLLAETSRAGMGSSVTLGPLGPDATAELVARAAGPDPPSGFTERLHRETEGLPLFIAEYLRAPREGGEPWGVPEGLRDLLDTRLAPLSDLARQVLSSAAVVGGEADVDVLRETSGRSEDETVAGLEELVAQGILVERGPAAYSFRHERVRTHALERLSQVRRRLLHRRAAEGLERGVRRDPGLASAVAAHYRDAGLDEEAAAAFARAAEHARRLAATREALGHLEGALAMGHPDPSRIHREIGELRVLLGSYPEALRSFQAAAALAPPEDLAPIEHRIGGVQHRLGSWDLADHHLREAAALTGDPGERARILADRSLTAHRAGRADDALALGTEALVLAEGAGDRAALAQAHNILGVLETRGGDLGRAREHLERSLEIADALGDPAARAAALNNLSLAARAGGDHDDALAFARRALALCLMDGDRHREAALHNNIADILHDLGRGEDAMDHLKQGVAIFAEIGEHAGGVQPEIWKLVEW